MSYTDPFRDSTTPWLVFIILPNFRQKQLGNIGEGGALGLTFTTQRCKKPDIIHYLTGSKWSTFRLSEGRSRRWTCGLIRGESYIHLQDFSITSAAHFLQLCSHSVHFEWRCLWCICVCLSLSAIQPWDAKLNLRKVCHSVDEIINGVIFEHLSFVCFITVKTEWNSITFQVSTTLAKTKTYDLNRQA